ncbi:MAG: hypothetical protein ABEJ82_06350 [Haloplanus sp.]
MSTSRRTIPTNRSRTTIDLVIPLQPRSGSGPTTDGRRMRPEPDAERGPEEPMIPLLDTGGLGPKPGRS